MRVRSLCRHYDTSFREEGEEFEHTGPLYEHIVSIEDSNEDPEDSPQKGEPSEPAAGLSRQQKPAKSR